MKYFLTITGLCIAATTVPIDTDKAEAKDFIQSSNIEVIDMINTSALQQLRFNVAITSQKSLLIGAATGDPTVNLKEVTNGIYKIESLGGQTVSVQAEDVGNVSGVKIKGVNAQYGEEDREESLIGIALSKTLITPDKGKDLRVELAQLEVNPQKMPAGANYVSPEFNLDVSYE